HVRPGAAAVRGTERRGPAGNRGLLRAARHADERRAHAAAGWPRAGNAALPELTAASGRRSRPQCAGVSSDLVDRVHVKPRPSTATAMLTRPSTRFVATSIRI